MPRRSNSVACCEGGVCSYRSRSPASAADAMLWQACAGCRTIRRCMPGRHGAPTKGRGTGPTLSIVHVVTARSPSPKAWGPWAGLNPRDIAPVTPCRSTVICPRSLEGAPGALPDVIVHRGRRCCRRGRLKGRLQIALGL